MLLKVRFELLRLLLLLQLLCFLWSHTIGAFAHLVPVLVHV